MQCVKLFKIKQIWLKYLPHLE